MHAEPTGEVQLRTPSATGAVILIRRNDEQMSKSYTRYNWMGYYAQVEDMVKSLEHGTGLRREEKHYVPPFPPRNPLHGGGRAGLRYFCETAQCAGYILPYRPSGRVRHRAVGHSQLLTVMLRLEVLVQLHFGSAVIERIDRRGGKDQSDKEEVMWRARVTHTKFGTSPECVWTFGVTSSAYPRMPVIDGAPRFYLHAEEPVMPTLLMYLTPLILRERRLTP